MNKFKSVIIRYSKVAFEPKYLLGTNLTLAAGLGLLGDTLAQKRKKLFEDRSIPHDYQRTLKMTTAGCFMGLGAHYWYLWLDKRFPGSAIRIVLKKVLVEQIVLSPVLIGGFLLVIGAMENSGREKLMDRIKTAGLRLYVAEWIVWPPAQIINFYFLPTQFRVLYVNSIALAFDIYASYLINDANFPQKESEE